MAKFCKIFFIFLFLTSVIFPQSRNINIEKITVDQGLSKREIRCILRDSKGFMWFGPELVLKRFDGYEFIDFRHDPNDSTSLSNDNVWAIIEDRTGSLWIGTMIGGLNRFDREKELFIHYNMHINEFPKNSGMYIYSFLEDKSGHNYMWA